MMLFVKERIHTEKFMTDRICNAVGMMQNVFSIPCTRSGMYTHATLMCIITIMTCLIVLLVLAKFLGYMLV